jgi:hypothetical protein
MAAWAAFAATKQDVNMLQRGAQAISRKNIYKHDGSRVLLELHNTILPHLAGELLESATTIFIEALYDCVDERFPAEKDNGYDWEYSISASM